MPTTKTRYQVTVTPELARALDVAARRWPETTSRSALLVALVELGAESLERQAEERRQLVDKYAGGFADVYYDGYLEELRQDWPA